MSNFFRDTMAKQLRKLQNEGQGMKVNFEEKFSQVNEENAFSEAQRGIHSVAQIIAHSTMLKKDALKNLEEGKISNSEKEPSEWVDNNVLREKGWDQIKREFEAAQLALSNKFVTLNNIAHGQAYNDQDHEREYNLSFTLQDILQHDHYHLGQLSMVIRILNSK